MVQLSLVLFVVVYLLPLALAALVYRFRGEGADWRSADRSSSGLLLPAARESQAVVRIFSARTVSWRGIFATHSWIVFKPAGASAYTRYDYTAWGEPIRLNGFVADGRWFGRLPEVVFAANGTTAAALIPKIENAVRTYRYAALGDYTAWPGPNSNTFVQAVVDAIPEIRTALPPTAIGKDFPYDGRWLRRTADGTGLQLTLGGYFGITIGWVDGIELNILGAVAGLDIRRPAVKVPGFGRIGPGSGPVGAPGDPGAAGPGVVFQGAGHDA